MSKTRKQGFGTTTKMLDICSDKLKCLKINKIEFYISIVNAANIAKILNKS